MRKVIIYILLAIIITFLIGPEILSAQTSAVDKADPGLWMTGWNKIKRYIWYGEYDMYNKTLYNPLYSYDSLMTVVFTDSATESIGQFILQNSYGPMEDDDILMEILFQANDDDENNVTWSEIEMVITDVTNDSKDSKLQFKTYSANSSATPLQLSGDDAIFADDVEINGTITLENDETIDNATDGTVNITAGVLKHGFDAAAYWSATQADGGLVTFNSVSDGTPGFTFLDQITGGADGTGVDVLLYSSTAGDNLLWDASEEALIITGTNGQDALDVEDGNVDIADDLDVDGTANFDAVDIDDNVDIAGLVNVGASGSYYTVTTGANIFGIYADDQTGTGYTDGISSTIKATAGDGNGALRPIQASATADVSSDLAELYGGSFYSTLADGGKVRSNMYGVMGWLAIDETDAGDDPTGYIAGLMGIYETEGINPTVSLTTPGAKAAVIGIVKDAANTSPHAAVMAFAEGDNGNGISIPAAFKATSVRSTTGDGFDYGLDLYDDAGHGTTVEEADIRLEDGSIINSNSGAPTLASATGLSGVNNAAYTVHKSVMTFSSYSMTITDAAGNGAHGSVKLIDFPEGHIKMIGAHQVLTCTRVGTDIHADAIFDAGVGTEAVGTDNDVLAGNEAVLTAKDDLALVAGTVTADIINSTDQTIDGSATSSDAYLNVAITEADCDGNDALTIDGTVTITWILLGDD